MSCLSKGAIRKRYPHFAHSSILFTFAALNNM